MKLLRLTLGICVIAALACGGGDEESTEEETTAPAPPPPTPDEPEEMVEVTKTFSQKITVKRKKCASIDNTGEAALSTKASKAGYANIRSVKVGEIDRGKENCTATVTAVGYKSVPKSEVE